MDSAPPVCMPKFGAAYGRVEGGNTHFRERRVGKWSMLARFSQAPSTRISTITMLFLRAGGGGGGGVGR